MSNLLIGVDFVVDGIIISDSSMRANHGIGSPLKFFKDSIYIYSVYSRKDKIQFANKKFIANWVTAIESNGSTDLYTTLYVPYDRRCLFFLGKCFYDSSAYQIVYYYAYEPNHWNEVCDSVSKCLVQNKWYRNVNCKTGEKNLKSGWTKWNQAVIHKSDSSYVVIKQKFHYSNQLSRTRQSKQKGYTYSNDSILLKKEFLYEKRRFLSAFRKDGKKYKKIHTIWTYNEKGQLTCKLKTWQYDTSKFGPQRSRVKYYKAFGK